MRTQVCVTPPVFGLQPRVSNALPFKLALRIAILVLASCSGLYAQSCDQNPDFTCSDGNPVCTNCSWSCPSGGTECTLPPSQYVCEGDPGGYVECGGGGWYCVPGPSPIIVDTTGEGFQLTSAQDGVVFDIFADGHPIQMAWTAAGSGNAFLALDRNHNGTIDSGAELFGNITQQPPSAEPNGFLALAEFDKPENGGNGDGIIDHRDAIFPHLLLWIDENHDGISQPSELHTLPEMGVYSLALKYSESRRTDKFGNQFRYKAAVNPDPEDGESQDGRWAFDVFLMVDRQGNAFLSLLQDRITPGPNQSQCGAQVPTASRITQTLSSHSVNSSNFSKCSSGQAGWYSEVQKIVTDQNGADIVLYLQDLVEKITIGTPNQLNITGVQTGTAVTDSNGEFDDTFFVCSSRCPGSGQTDASQTISDTLPDGSGPYNLSPNSLVYKCSGITVNGQ